MFTPTLRCECAQPASDRLMRKWCIEQPNHVHLLGLMRVKRCNDDVCKIILANVCFKLIFTLI